MEVKTVVVVLGTTMIFILLTKENIVSGDPVCYSHQLQNHRTVRIEKILCSNDSGNIQKKFQSKQEVSVAELINTAYAFVAESTSPPLAIIDPDCSDWSTPDNGSYVLIKTKLNWFDAATACRQYGENAHLAFIECKTENEFISNFIEQELRDVDCEISTYFCNVWIGLNDLIEKGVWKWYNKTLQSFEGQVFQLGGAGDESCARIRNISAGIWADINCFSLFYSICET